MELPPDKVDGFFADVVKIAADLRDREITPDELERARKPRVEELEKLMATNEFWLSGLAGLQNDPRRLDALRSMEAGILRVTTADVRRAAQTYLKDETAWRLVVKPAPGAPAAAAR